MFVELQIGVLKDSAAFRDAVNLAANITSEPHNYHLINSLVPSFQRVFRVQICYPSITNAVLPIFALRTSNFPGATISR